MSIKNLIPTFRNRNQLPVRHLNDDNPFQMMQREMNRLFDNVMSDFSLFPSRERFMDSFPQIDLKDTDKEIIVDVEIPGMDQKDINISISDNVLTIRGEKQQEKEEKKSNFYHVERSYGSFHRDIPLHAEIEEDKVSAKYKKGVLKINLPKTPEAQRKHKKIPIQVS